MPEYDRCPDWVRPCEWPDLPEIGPNEEKIVGLVAVEETDSEFLAVLCEGDYVVDWGDGSPEEYIASGEKAEHHYNYLTVPGEPVCPSPSSSDYDGYKTVIVTITPQPPSSSSDSSSSEAPPALTKVDFQQRHSTAATNGHLAKWLDLDLNIPHCTSLTLGPPIVNNGYGDMYLTVSAAQISWLQQFTLRQHALTSLYRLFTYCANLKKVTLLNTGSVTNTQETFFRCSSLIKVDPFDTSAVTTMYRMFGYCYALKCVPLLDTSAVTDFSYMFVDCLSLPQIPALDTSAATTLKGMLRRCETLKEVPTLNTSNATDLSELFRGCVCLREIPEIDTSSATTIASMFETTFLLRKIPALNTSSVTNMSRLFYGCAVTVLPAFDCSGITSSSSLSNWFYAMNFITRSKLYGLRYTHSYHISTSVITVNRALTASALNEIFTNLGTAAGSQTITITNCLGAATCDRTIATAKGWTVVG
jgi:surface protein